MKIIKRNNAFSPSVNSAFNHFLTDDFLNWPAANAQKKWQNLPPVNISENDESFKVDLAAPGFNKDDFKLELDNNKLSVSAEHKSDKEGKTENFSHKEFIQSSFTRTFHLPENKVAEGDIKANYENGVLSLSLPKKEEAKRQAPRKIEIF